MDENSYFIKNLPNNPKVLDDHDTLIIGFGVLKSFNLQKERERRRLTNP